MSDVTVVKVKKYLFSPPAEHIILHEDPKCNHLKSHCFFKTKPKPEFIDTLHIMSLIADETHVMKVTNAFIKEDFHTSKSSHAIYSC